MNRHWIKSSPLPFLIAFGCSQQVPSPSFDADQATVDVSAVLLSEPSTALKAQEIGDKDVALTHFQRANGISDAIAEAAIKEWVLTHGGDFDYDLDDVKAICLRNKAEGIPERYLPVR